MSAEATSGAADNPGQSARLLDLSMPAERTALATVTAAVSDTLARLLIPEDKQFEILLAVQEALANAVVHGCKNDASKEVRCQMESYPNGRILIVVTDPGAGFAPEQLPDPNHLENLEADHGRGVYMIRRLMDEVSFGNNGSEIRMWKY
jgi:serine/threonine-protein kinase RsbW